MQLRSFRRTQSFSVPPLMTVVLVCMGSMPLTMGQKPTHNPSTQVKPAAPAPAPSTQQSPSPEGTSIRSWRAAPDSPDQKPAEDPTTPVTPKVSEKSTAAVSGIGALRDEMNAATNEQLRARLQLKLVDHFLAAGLKQEAITALKAMSEEERFDPQCFYNIGNAQARLGEVEGAIKSYRKAIDQRNGRYSRAANNLGVLLMRTGQWDEAYEALISALRQENFRYAEASFNLGRLYAARGESDLAVREWRRAVTVDPEHVAAARALSNTGNASDIAIASRVLKSKPRSSADPNSAPSDWVRATSNLEATKPSSRGIKPQSPRSRPLPAYTIDPEAYALLLHGRTAREQGRNEDAASDFQQVLARTGGYFPPANLELSYVLIALKRMDEAIATLLPVAERDGSVIPISHYHLARLYEARGELKLAEDHYSRAAEAFNGSLAQFLLDVARVRERQGNLAGALKSLEQYIATMERQGHKPEWSEERLAELRQKLVTSQPKP